MVAELDCFGKKCRIAWSVCSAVVKRSAKPSTAGPKKPVGETSICVLVSVRLTLTLNLTLTWAE